MKINLLIDGGNMKPGPTLSQKLGPAGINMNQVIQKINESTKHFDGLRVPVILDIDVGKKTFDVVVKSPPVSELLKKEAGVLKGSGTQKKTYIGNLSIEQIISVAKVKMPDMLCKDLKSAVKTVAGTCVSLGIMIESKHPVEVEREIEKGIYDKEIKSESTKTPEGKKRILAEYFAGIKEQQEKKAKADAAAAEAAKAAAEAAAGTSGTAATTAAGTQAATAAKPAAKSEKKPEKK